MSELTSATRSRARCAGWAARVTRSARAPRLRGALLSSRSLWHSPAAFRRIHLTMREIYFSGVLSLVIILMSGLFVGMVLALQGYEVLQRYGADERSASWSRCRWCASSGPVVAGLLFASRAGSRDHRRDRPDEGDRAALGDGNDGGRSDRARRRAALLGRRHLDAAARGAVLGVRASSARYLVGVRLIGIDAGAFWGNMQAGVDFRPDIVNGIIKSVVFGARGVADRGVRRLRREADRRRRVERDDAHRRRSSSLAILALDFVLTVFMFTGSRRMNRSAIDLWVGDLRRRRPRRDPVSRAEGRQPADARIARPATVSRRTSTTSAA